MINYKINANNTKPNGFNINLYNQKNINNATRDIKEVLNKETTYNDNDTGFVALGYKDNFNYVYSKYKQTIFILTTKDFTKFNFYNYFGEEYCVNFIEFIEKNNEVKEVFNTSKLALLIINECQKKGIYNIENQNGFGIFKLNSEELLINSKELLKFNINTKQITKLSNRIINNNVFLNIKDININYNDFINKNELKDTELKDLYNFINTWKFARKNDDKIYLGWLISSIFSGASDWRSHVSLTGAQGSGKSALIEQSVLLFNQLLIDFDGNSTEAGIRQKIGSSACGVLVDESEADNDKLKNRLEFFRTASSGSTIAKGTSDQKGLNFKIQVSGLIAGIVEPQFENPADASRFIIIKLLDKEAIIKENAHFLYDNKEELQKIGKKIILKMLNNFDIYLKNLYIFKTLLTKKYNVSRFADTVAPSLSAFYTLFFTNSNEEKIKMFLNEFDFTNEEEQNNTKDHTNAIDYLYNYVFKFNEYKFNFSTIIAKNLFKEEIIKNELGNFGIKIKEDVLEYKIYIDAKNNNFYNIFKDTKFAKGNLTTLLSRNENIKILKDSIMINNVRTKRNNALLLTINKDYFKDCLSDDIIEIKNEIKDIKKINFEDLSIFKDITKKNFNINNIKQKIDLIKDIKENNSNDESVPIFEAELELIRNNIDYLKDKLSNEDLEQLKKII